MDLDELNTELRNLRELPTPPRPPIEVLAARTRRRRRRRTLGVTLAGVTAVVATGVGLRAATGDDGVRVSSQGPDATAVDPEAPAGTVVVPDLLGRTLSVAVSMADDLGFSLTASEGDVSVADAVIVATEPGAGVAVPSGSVIGARTALPDPPVDVECPNSRHPRGKVLADALPSSDGLGRSAADAAVVALRAETPESSDTEVYLGIWDRWAYTDDAGLEVVPTKGYQVIVVSQDPANCPSAPSFRDVPVTVVLGDLTSWAGEVIETATPNTVNGIEVDTPSGWSAEPSTNEQGEVLYLRGDSGAELTVVVRPTPSEAIGADEVLKVVSAFGDSSAIITEVEGGYALYAALDCPAEPCERVEVFGYNLSLAEFTELSSGL